MRPSLALRPLLGLVLDLAVVHQPIEGLGVVHDDTELGDSLPGLLGFLGLGLHAGVATVRETVEVPFAFDVEHVSQDVAGTTI